MNDEIKELLDYLKDEKWDYYPSDMTPYKVFLMEERDKLLDYITNLQQKYDRALEDSVKETHKLMAIRKYLKDNEREYGSLEDNEKIILGIIEGKYDE